MKTLVVTITVACLVAASSAKAADTKAPNAAALQSQKYGPAPAYDPPRGQAVRSDAPGAIQKATNPNPNAYKYTKEYQAASPAQQKKVDDTVKVHQKIMDHLRSNPGAANAAK
jgi:homoserine acetyltransferase